MTTDMIEFLEDEETQNKLLSLYNNPEQIMLAIAAKLRAAEELAHVAQEIESDECSLKHALYDLRLALRDYRKAGEKE